MNNYVVYLPFTLLFAAALGLTVFMLERRKRFPLRLAAGLALYAAAYVLAARFSRALRAGWISFSFPVIISAGAAAILLCFGISCVRALFHVSIAYTMQHTASKLFAFVRPLLPRNIALGEAIYIAIGAAAYAAIYFLFVRKADTSVSERNFLEPKNSTAAVSIISMAIVYVLSSYADTKGYSTVVNLYGLSCCLLLIFIEFGLFRRNKIHIENAVMKQLLAMEHKQHELSKENIEIINMKCHNLKHQIASLRSMTSEERLENRLKELEKLTVIYDATTRTGNAALDLLLVEKKLLCEKHGIRFHTLVSAAAIALFDEETTYSLFGNILDNAIESLRETEEKDKRALNLHVTQQGNILCIHSDNYCKRKLEFRNSLPVTTKGDRAVHGYGTASIKRIVTGYRGTLVIKQENDVFSLNITIPVPRRSDAV